MFNVNYNERSWGIDLISRINKWADERDVIIKSAGGENTIKNDNFSQGQSKFPDILLFGDSKLGKIIQGWELKFPDTAIDNDDLLKNAKEKAEILGLSHFLVWNVSNAVLYKICQNDDLEIIKSWDHLSKITTRDEVVLNREETFDLLDIILEDLLQYFNQGSISPSSYFEMVGGENLSKLIMSNVSVYANSLKKATEKSQVFKDNFILWWRYNKDSFVNVKEKDKWNILARNNILFLLNKFLFAHLLKKYYQIANLVNTIDQTYNIKNGLKIFSSISEECNFLNIFNYQLGEEYIPDIVWKDFIQLNALLVDLSLENLKSDVLHRILIKCVYQNSRKSAGQFVTPGVLADFITSIVITDNKEDSLDPFCGTGTIAKSIYNKKISSISHEEALRTTWASDKFLFPLQIANIALTEPTNIGSVIRIFQNDAFNVESGMDIEFKNPNSGKNIKEKLPKFKYIISNLPFIKNKNIKKLNLDSIKKSKEKINKEGLIINSKSDFYGYIPSQLFDLLKKGGLLAIITSNSWLSTGWGDDYKNILEYFYKIKSVIISRSEKWFDEPDVISTITILEKRENLGSNNSSDVIKFVSVNKKLVDIKNNFDEVSSLIRSKENIHEDELAIRSYNKKEIEEFSSLGISWNALFTDNSWLHKIKEMLKPANHFFDISRGTRRGWDDMFFPEGDHGIEKKYLKRVLKTPRSLSSLIAEPDAYAFCCDISKEELRKKGDLGALNWIEKFEKRTNTTGKPLPESLNRPNINWYTLTPSTVADLVMSINYGERLFVSRFKSPTFVNQRLTRLTLKNRNIDKVLLHALMNSILGLFFIEAIGFGRGQGALDLSSTRIKKYYHLLNPDLINKNQAEKIKTKFKKVTNLSLSRLKEELRKKERVSFDKLVLESYGLVDLYEDIKESLLLLQDMRLSIDKD